MNSLDDVFESMFAMARGGQTPAYEYTPLEPAKIDTLRFLAESYRENSLLGGFQYTAYFKNGYGIDIVKHNGSYGREDDLWEIAVMLNGECCYKTPITDDVIGYLTSDQVMDYALKVKALDPA